MATKDESMGTYGTIRVEIIQNSQNQSANTSNITVRGRIKKSNSGTSADSTGNCDSKLTGTLSKTDQTNFSISDTSWHTMISTSGNVTHDANGYKTATASFTFGPTITTAFGSSKDTVGTLSMALTRIPKIPAAPVQAAPSFSVPNTVTVNWAAPDMKGSTLVRYEVGYDETNSTAALTVINAATSLSKAISGLGIGKTWYFFVRAVNGVGTGPWSAVQSVTIPNIPSQITTRSVTWIPPRALNIVWSAPANGGAVIDGYLVRWNTNNVSSSTTGGGQVSVSAATLSYQISGLTNNTTYYVFIFPHNSQGYGSASSALSYTIPNIPGTPGAPTPTYSPPNTVSLAFTAPSNGGAAITAYTIEYADNAAFTSSLSVSATSSPKVITGLTPGKTYWFRYRATNSQGTGSNGPSASVKILSGPRIWDYGWKTTIAYVYGDDLEWHIAIPFRRNADGSWNNAGG